MGLALLALAYRLILLSTTMTPPDSDQSVTGLMALHILRGDRPIFFYGQSYNGAIEAYLTAAVFRLLGPDNLTLRLAPALLSALFVAQIYILARRLYGPFVALAAGLWLAFPPSVLAFWSMAAGAGYVEPTVLGTGMLMIAIRRWGLGRPRRYDLPALGLLAGLGIWAQPMIANYYLALALALIPLAWRALVMRPAADVDINGRGTGSPGPKGPWQGTTSPGPKGPWQGTTSPGPKGPWQRPDPKESGGARFVDGVVRPALVVGVFFAIGGAPWLIYTVGHLRASLTVLTNHALPWSLPDLLHRLATETLPVLLGGAIPTGYADQFARYVAAHPVPYILTLGAAAYALLRLIASPRGLLAQARALLAGRPLADAPLAMLLIAVFALYMASRFKTLSWTTRNPRYLLPLYTAVPYALACLVESRKSKVESELRGEGRRAKEGLGIKVAGIFAQRTPIVHCFPATAHRLTFARRPSPFAFVVAVAIAINIYGGARYADLPSTSMATVAPLVSTLVARGDGVVYADYWIAWRMAFESKERLAAVAILGVKVDHNPRGDRYPPYLKRAAQARRWAYILPDRDVPRFVALLRHYHVPYHHWRWGTSALFYNHWNWGRPNIFDGPVVNGFPLERVGVSR